MRPLRTRLQEARQRLGVPWPVLERDYLLSWLLAGLGQVSARCDTLVFKGGTALKKCYFGDYRFSEDLDFSGLDGLPRGEAMERAVRQACETAVEMREPSTGQGKGGMRPGCSSRLTRAQAASSSARFCRPHSVTRPSARGGRVPPMSASVSMGSPPP